MINFEDFLNKQWANDVLEHLETLDEEATNDLLEQLDEESIDLLETNLKRNERRANHYDKKNEGRLPKPGSPGDQIDRAHYRSALAGHERAIKSIEKAPWAGSLLDPRGGGQADRDRANFAADQRRRRRQAQKHEKLLRKNKGQPEDRPSIKAK